MWIARDKYGGLFVYENKPIKTEYGTWEDPTNPNEYYGIDGDAFPEVRLDDEEPRELVLKPIKEELGFVNLYKDGGQVKVGWKIFPTKKEAEENFKDDEKYITTVNIQWRDSNDNL